MISASSLTCHIEGVLVAYDVGGLMKAALITGPDSASVVARLLEDGAELVEQGALTLRLGVALYDRPFLFVPHTILDEKGTVFKGEVVFDWLRARAYDMPRSEVFGVNARGQEDQVFARDIDVESSPIVIGGSETSPMYVAASIGTGELPSQFASALKRCASPDPPEVRRIVESA